ncbi:DUF4326 domain-containing protein [Mycolicibacterium sphagni]|nr:DUF4326 domain-containing protein [Mycolicibacterium sphagni]
MPQRIRLRRTAGWRKPPNTISVARPSRWGNPFRVKGRDIYGNGWRMYDSEPACARKSAVRLYRDLVSGLHNPANFRRLTDEQYRNLTADLDAWKQRIGGHPLEIARSELAGHNLACFCDIFDPCHADVLLRAANT